MAVHDTAIAEGLLFDYGPPPEGHKWLYRKPKGTLSSIIGYARCVPKVGLQPNIFINPKSLCPLASKHFFYSFLESTPHPTKPQHEGMPFDPLTIKIVKCSWVPEID